MRDIVIVGIVLYCFILSLRKPYIGFLLWAWLSFMTPHKLAYGFSVSMPLALIAIIGTVTGMLIDKDKGKFFQHGIVTIQILFLLWTVITTILAIFPELSEKMLSKFSKIMLGIFISYLLINSTEKLNKLIWVIYISVGYYGVKGGIFTLLTGGGNKVWGPDDSFIGGNNELACALLMIMPLGIYLASTVTEKRLKICLILSLGIIGISVLGSNSRGAFIGLLVLMLFWFRKVPGKQKVTAIIVTIFITIIALSFMPESFWERMNTVKTYDKDASAMGRINAWWCAYYLALDRFSGAGFDYATSYAFYMYAPNPKDIHTAHSIYLQVLGDHGFLGLFLFLTIIIWTWIVLDKIIKNTSVDLDLRWANQLARMLQLSFIAFFVAGAFLSLPYYDLFWQLVAISVIINTLVTNHSKERAAFMTDQTIAESVPFLMNSFVKNVS